MVAGVFLKHNIMKILIGTIVVMGIICSTALYMNNHWITGSLLLVVCLSVGYKEKE